MTIREIRIFGDPVLKTVSDPVVTIDDGVRALVEDLLDTVRLPGRAGVAAPQIGVNRRVFSYNVDGAVGYVINPQIVETSGEIEERGEGCLSVPELWFAAPRYPFARVRGINLAGEPIEVAGTDLLAQALQHEIDHLDGMLYLDRLAGDTRREAMKMVRQSEWF